MYTQWFHRRALLIGWLCGMIAATSMAIATGFKPNITVHIGDSAVTGFLALYALAINIVVSAALTPLFDGMRVDRGVDTITAADYA
jgi:SSS family solute:Na+ symporter